ncbi:hypothetical protein [Ferrimonas pelagia]|uniref:DUF4124 domain-containing protein n=1 Tax=Ferrimonas pelagia TaxID=1177826 RepID=A0ABP9FDV2_9GAMM
MHKRVQLRSLFLALLGHIVLLWAISQWRTEIPLARPDVPALESYLYLPPAAGVEQAKALPLTSDAVERLAPAPANNEADEAPVVPDERGERMARPRPQEPQRMNAERPAAAESARPAQSTATSQPAQTQRARGPIPSPQQLARGYLSAQPFVRPKRGPIDRAPLTSAERAALIDPHGSNRAIEWQQRLANGNRLSQVKGNCSEVGDDPLDKAQNGYQVWVPSSGCALRQRQAALRDYWPKR